MRSRVARSLAANGRASAAPTKNGPAEARASDATASRRTEIFILGNSPISIVRNPAHSLMIACAGCQGGGSVFVVGHPGLAARQPGRHGGGIFRPVLGEAPAQGRLFV